MLIAKPVGGSSNSGILDGRAEWEGSLKVTGTVMAGYSVGGIVFGVAGSIFNVD